MDEVRVGLAFIAAPPEPVFWLKLLSRSSVRATFFLAPDDLVENGGDWRAAVEDGHELGNGALVGATADGRLDNWNFATLDEDLRDTDRLLLDLGMAEVQSGFLPGRVHTCADGDYRSRFQRLFDAVVSDDPEALRVKGRDVVRLIRIDEPSEPDVPAILIMPARRGIDAQQLEELAARSVGPVCRLIR